MSSSSNAVLFSLPKAAPPLSILLQSKKAEEKGNAPNQGTVPETSIISPRRAANLQNDTILLKGRAANLSRNCKGLESRRNATNQTLKAKRRERSKGPTYWPGGGSPNYTSPLCSVENSIRQT